MSTHHRVSRRLGEYPDLDRAERRMVDSHLRQCDACRGTWSDEQAVRAYLESLPEVDPPPGLEARLLAIPAREAAGAGTSGPLGDWTAPAMMLLAGLIGLAAAGVSQPGVGRASAHAPSIAVGAGPDRAGAPPPAGPTAVARAATRALPEAPRATTLTPAAGRGDALLDRSPVASPADTPLAAATFSPGLQSMDGITSFVAAVRSARTVAASGAVTAQSGLQPGCWLPPATTAERTPSASATAAGGATTPAPTPGTLETPVGLAIDPTAAPTATTAATATATDPTATATDPTATATATEPATPRAPRPTVFPAGGTSAPPNAEPTESGALPSSTPRAEPTAEEPRAEPTTVAPTATTPPDRPQPLPSAIPIRLRPTPTATPPRQRPEPGPTKLATKPSPWPIPPTPTAQGPVRAGEGFAGADIEASSGSDAGEDRPGQGHQLGGYRNATRPLRPKGA